MNLNFTGSLNSAWKCENLLGEKQSKFTEASTPLHSFSAKQSFVGGCQFPKCWDENPKAGCARFPEIWTFFMRTQRNWEFRRHRK